MSKTETLVVDPQVPCRRILVTGAGGYLGSSVVRALAAAQHTVLAVDRACEYLRGPHVEVFEGDFADGVVIERALAGGCDAVVHLATYGGGSAVEADPGEAFRVNVTGTAALLDAARARGRMRFVFASSIAVFGAPLPPTVEDATPLQPRLVYGAHKAMGEVLVAAMSRRGDLDGLSIRLPAIVARPAGAAGVKSAFMSDVFHAARRRESFTSPVSEQATFWIMSRPCLVRNILTALAPPSGRTVEPFAVMLPAVRTSMAALAATLSAQTGAPRDFVRCEPDPALEASFGAQPPLVTRAAERLGFSADASLDALVAEVLADLNQG